jgi:raffinose/stachyose/melibiose transport system permease protein
MTWGGPGVRSSYLAVYMFRTAFIQSQLGMGTAIGINILLFSLAFTYLFNRFFSREAIEY